MNERTDDEYSPTAPSFSLFHDLIRLTCALSDVLKKEKNLIDFQSITQKVSNLFDSPETQGAIEVYCEKNIQHFFLDESQDLSWSQAKILHNIVHTFAHLPKSFFIVGDPQQAIYYFRGSDLSVFQSFESLSCPGLTIYSDCLKENYRSTPQLVNFVNLWSAHVFGPLSSSLFGIDKALASLPCSTQSGGLFENHLYLSVDVEAYAIASQVAQRHQANPKETIAILARDRRTLRPIASWLRSLRLFPECAELENIYDQELYHDLLSFLKLLLNPAERSYWLPFLRSRWLRASYADIEIIYAQSLTQFWALSQDTLSPLLRADLAPWCQALHEFEPYKGRLSSYDYIHRLLLALQLESTLAAFERTLYKDLLAAFHRLLEGESCDWSALDSWAKNSPLKLAKPQGAITLLTIHKSKGLEFDTVFLPNCAARLPVRQTPQAIFTRQPQGALHAAELDRPTDLFDKLLALEKYHHEYEAWRLLYVALTRAKSNLILSSNQERSDKRSFYGALDFEGNTHLPAQTEQSIPLPSALKSLNWKTPLPSFKPLATDRVILNTSDLSWKALPSLIEDTVLGKVWHTFLQHQKSFPFPADFLTKDLWQQWWFAHGGNPEDFEVPLRTFGKTLVRLQKCPVIASMFAPNLLQVFTEQEYLYRDSQGRVQNIRIDRLVQRSDRSWWLIDWKTSSQALQRAQQIRTQLQGYRDALEPLYGSPIAAGIYILSEQRYVAFEEL